MNDKYAPLPGCECDVCQWANRILNAQRLLDEDLEANYQRYLAGELVSRDGRD